MNLNKVFLLGNLTRDPELKNLPSGQQVCSFSMATNKIWTDKETSEKKQKVEFHNIVAWRNLATIASQYLKKGGLVFIEGHLTTRSWDDASGNKKYRTEVIADNIQLGPRTTGTGQASISPIKEPDIKTKQPLDDSKEKSSVPEEIPTINEGDDINLDEIPF